MAPGAWRARARDEPESEVEMGTRQSSIPVEHVEVSAYTIPTDGPEADGTYAWDSTTLVVAEVDAGGRRGLGYTYADTATAALIKATLANAVTGRDAMDVPGCWGAMLMNPWVSLGI